MIEPRPNQGKSAPYTFAVSFVFIFPVIHTMIRSEY